MAPRAGFAYDINGDGRWKAFGSWGVFYDIFKLELPRGSFGGDKWIEYYYTLDTFNWPTLVDSPACPPACPGTLLRTTDFRHISVGSNAIDPDLKPMRQQEATAGIEHQLNDVMSLSVRYVHKQIDRAIEDTQTASLDADGNEIYIIANPGEGLAEPAFADPPVKNPKPVRDYDSVEFAFEKRFAKSWYLRSSYLWSRLFGNYSGLTQSDENGRTSPNVGRLWDYPMMMFQDGGTPVFGPLATDRPHQFKTQFIYQLPVGTSVGVDQYVASGLPVSREIGIFAGNNLPVNYLGRMSDGRTPTYSQTDFLVQHSFRFGGRAKPSGELQRAEPVQPVHRGRQVLHVPQDQRSESERRVVLRRDADARRSDRQPEHRAGSAVPDGQQIPSADSGQVWREVPVLTNGLESGTFPPRGLRPAGLFFGGRPCAPGSRWPEWLFSCTAGLPASRDRRVDPDARQRGIEVRGGKRLEEHRHVLERVVHGDRGLVAGDEDDGTRQLGILGRSARDRAPSRASPAGARRTARATAERRPRRRAPPPPSPPRTRRTRAV